MKICSKCKRELPEEMFCKQKDSKDGLRSQCKDCGKQYREANKEKLAEYHKQYREANKYKIGEKRKQHRETNKDKIAEYYKQYYEANKDKLAEQNKQYYEANKDKIKQYREANKDKLAEQNKQYYKANKDKIAEYYKQYYEANKDKLAEYHKQYVVQRKKTDYIFALKCQIRTCIRQSFNRKQYTKSLHTKQIVGCTIDELIEHLNNTYLQNYGIEYDGTQDVHIDHIIPLATVETEEEIIKLCNYKNLQLLNAEDNLAKSDKIVL